MKGCEPCAKVREQTPGAPEHEHVCKVDVDLLDHIGSLDFARLRGVDEQIQRNLVRAEAFIATAPFPRNADFTGFLAYCCGVHRALLQGTGILGGGGVIRTKDVQYGERRLAKPVGTIDAELERLARTSLPVDPASNTREQFATFAAQLLHRLLDIHPFDDLNGRMSRMVVRGMVASSGRYQLRLVASHQDGDAHEAYVRALRTVDTFGDDVRGDDARTPAGAYARLAEHLLPEIIDEEVSEEPPLSIAP